MLSFEGDAPIKIAINDRNHDNYPDISVYPLDACSKFLWTYYNTLSASKLLRDYRKEFVDVGAKLDSYATSSENATQNYISDVNNSIASMTGENNELKDILNNASEEQMTF